MKAITDRRRAMLAKIHLAKKDLGLDEDGDIEGYDRTRDGRRQGGKFRYAV